MKMMTITFKDSFGIDKVDIKEITDKNDVPEIKDKEFETYGTTELYEIKPDEKYIIIGETLESMLRTILKDFDSFEDIVEIVKAVFEKGSINEEPERFVINNFPHIYVTHLNNKKHCISF